MATRKRPRLTKAERQSRAERARKRLLPASVKATGRKGFRQTVAALEPHRDKVSDPARLAGWLKSRALYAGVLSPRHKYKGRRKTTRR
jgi:hypothetical protein